MATHDASVGCLTEGPSAFLALAEEGCVSLTTYRRDGTPVATPVFVVGDGARLLVHTEAATGKVKRIRNNPNVQIAACDSSGAVRGPVFKAQASFSNDVTLTERLIKRKYGPVVRVLELLYATQRALSRRPKATGLTIVITPRG